MKNTIIAELEGVIKALESVREDDPWNVTVDNNVRHLKVIVKMIQQLDSVETPKNWEESVANLNNLMQ